MHEASNRPDHRRTPSGHQGEHEPWDQPTPGLLSQSDPESAHATGRPPIWLMIIVVLLLAGVIVLHLTGVVGPGSH